MWPSDPSSSAPNHWLALKTGDDGTLLNTLATTVKNFALLIELSGSHVAVRVSGPNAREVIAKGLPLDLHARAMGPGDAGATVVAHLSVLVWQVNDAPTYDLMCARSFAGSFHRWLELAGAPVIRGLQQALPRITGSGR